MAQHGPALWDQSLAREVIGTVAVLAGLFFLTDKAWQAVVPIAVLSAGMLAHEFADEHYDLPDGTNWVFYGVTVAFVGAFLFALDSMVLGGVMIVVGCWFAFDGATTAKYAPPKTTHEYVSGIDDEKTEVMLRMQTLSSVYHHLKDATGPRTTAEIADALDLTESRTESALGYLESKDRVERAGTEYRASPSRWGRLSPVVSVVEWLPRRVLRPFDRIANTH